MNFGLKILNFFKMGGNDRYINRCWFNKDIGILVDYKFNMKKLYGIVVEL